jgi:hypothetical protein
LEDLVVSSVTVPEATTHQLRSYIAPGCPATRTPCDGTEAPLRVEFGFTPRWYHERLKIDFGPLWHRDPLYRHKTVVAMRKELNRRFPELRLGGPFPDETHATIDGVHGALTVPMIFGIAPQYYPAEWPVTRKEYLSEAVLRHLRVPNLSATPVIMQLLEQMEVIEREFGYIGGYINWQGVLNNAFRIRGHEIFTDVLTDAGLARHLFEVITQTMIAGMRLIYGRQRASGVVIRHATVSNCVVNMVSPQIYEELLLPCDRMISDAFDHFGVHNCAWNVDPYIDAYATIRKLGYVDMGIESDLARAKRLCPDARRAIMYTPTDLATKSMNALRDDLTRIYRELGPCDVVMADIDPETPDERVLAFAHLAREIGDEAKDS